MSPIACPTREELAGFATGGLPAPTFERVARHVEACAVCDVVLAELDGLADEIGAELRQPVPDAGLTEETVIRAVLVGFSGAPGTDRPLLGSGKRLGRFELLAELGTGSFGQVFHARDVELGREVAIKVFWGERAGRDEVNRFLREARSAAHLKHPGIVALYETGETESGAPYLVEELIEGPTLEARLKSGPLSFRAAAELAASIADALAYAHAHGVIHRDVKPANVMLGPDGQPHVMDFGLAKCEAVDELPATLEGVLLGTPAYMNPEQAHGDSRQVDAGSDIYSLGVILYELLTGERPFRGNLRMLLRQVLEDEPRPPRQLNDRIPRDLETVCLKALAKAPARRYATAADLAADLRRFLAGGARPRPARLIERGWLWCRRNPVPASLFLAMSIGAIVGLGHLSRLSESLVRSTALEGAAQQAEILEEVNNFYSAEVVERAEAGGVKATHDYATRRGTIPLPATLTIDLGKQLSADSDSGTQVRLYSDHPFRSRRDGGPLDDFERQALAELRKAPDQPFHRFEDFQGRPSLRYATARRMQQACVRCHNTHPDSTKRDWKAGDVRGVLEIIRPLHRDVSRARAGLRETFLLVTAVFGSLLGLSVLILLTTRRRGPAPSGPPTYPV